MSNKSSKYLSMEFVMEQAQRTGILKDLIESLLLSENFNKLDEHWRRENPYKK